MKARTDFLKSVGRSRSGDEFEHRRVAVALDERRGERAFGKPGHLAEHLLGGVPVEVDERAGTQCLVDAEHLEQVEDLVTDIALIVAHGSSSMRTPLTSVGYSN